MPVAGVKLILKSDNFISLPSLRPGEVAKISGLIKNDKVVEIQVFECSGDCLNPENTCLCSLGEKLYSR